MLLKDEYQTFHPRKESLDGIVHLHGCLNNHVNNNLVLSSRDFAKAYMTDAWATTFFKKILLFFECHHSNESFLDQMHKYRSLFLRSRLLENMKLIILIRTIWSQILDTVNNWHQIKVITKKQNVY
jgi:hypothetical protein